jgi:hypothetical protein
MKRQNDIRSIAIAISFNLSRSRRRSIGNRYATDITDVHFQGQETANLVLRLTPRIVKSKCQRPQLQ